MILTNHKTITNAKDMDFIFCEFLKLKLQNHLTQICK